MSKFFKKYHDAYDHAVASARATKADHGISKTTELGSKGFVVRMLPRPENSYGSELSAERVTPNHPVTKSSQPTAVHPHDVRKLADAHAAVGGSGFDESQHPRDEQGKFTDK